MTIPNSIPAVPLPGFATYVPNRHPEIKFHKTIGQAKNALINKHYGRNGFESDMAIYLLGYDMANREQIYRPVIKVTKGTQREEYPELAPKPMSKRQQQYRADWAAKTAAWYAEEAKKKQEEADWLMDELNGKTNAQ